MKEETYIHIRLKKELQEKLKAEAKEKCMSLNSYINLILQKRRT
jgi:predicted HicB family RNase H-like nuclease